jgi:NAD(P)-dependent dehydrogenase (short-subunit alcohol dehydrogenase family)
MGMQPFSSTDLPVSPHSLSGRRAVVTGSSTGIGRAIAMELAAAGADLVVHGNSHPEAAREVANAIDDLGTQAMVVLGDLATRSGQERLVHEAWQSGPVDIWINNAGADVLTGAAASWSFDSKLERLWQVDVVGTIQLSRAVGRRMHDRGRGVILNMGWDQVESGMEGDSGQMFATVKGAVTAFSRSLAKTLAPRVRVNVLAPGWIRTAWGESASESMHERAQHESLLGRWGTAEDVARAARFLVSDEASFINGQILQVNGGFNSGGETKGGP